MKNLFKKMFGWISKDEKKQKAMSFRIFATIGTFGVAYALTGGNAFVSLPIAGAQAVTNTLIYYEHEKIWENKPKEVLPELSDDQRKHLRENGDFLFKE